MFVFLRCVILVLLVSSCAQVREFKAMSRPALASTADEVLDSAVYGICVAPSAGSLGRRYSTKERMEIWRAFCKMDSQTELP